MKQRLIGEGEFCVETIENNRSAVLINVWWSTIVFKVIGEFEPPTSPFASYGPVLTMIIFAKCYALKKTFSRSTIKIYFDHSTIAKWKFEISSFLKF